MGFLIILLKFSSRLEATIVSYIDVWEKFVKPAIIGYFLKEFDFFFILIVLSG